MNTSKLTHKEKLEIAIKTVDYKVQEELSNDPSMLVRRNLALNPTLSTYIANKLLFDPTSNVVYCSTKNRNTTKFRDINNKDFDHRCVVCDLDIFYEKCSTCTFNRKDKLC